MPRHIGTDKDGKPIPNPERRDLFRAAIVRYGFTSGEIQKHAESCRDAFWIGEHLGSHDTQTTSLRALKAVQMYAFGKRGRPRFKGRKRMNSVEGKSDVVIRYRDGVLHWGGLSVPVMLDSRDKDGWQHQAVAAPLRYCRVMRRRICDRDRWYVQIDLKGLPPLKTEHVLGQGEVGLDLGPSTIAKVSESHASLRLFCPTVDDISRELRRIQRAMDRSRRATNPDNDDLDGTVKKGRKRWVYSSRCRDLWDEKTDAERRLASEGRGRMARTSTALWRLASLQTGEAKLQGVAEELRTQCATAAPGMYVPTFTARLSEPAEWCRSRPRRTG